MNPATLLSLGAAVLQLGFAVGFALLAGAPGWQRARLYALMAFAAAAYSGSDVLVTIPGIPASTLRATVAANYLFGAVNVALWLVLAFGAPTRPWWRLPRPIGVLAAITIGLGLVAQIPGVVTTTGIEVLHLPRMHTTYYQPPVTWVSGIVSAWFVAMLVVVVVRFTRAARRREPDAVTHLIAYAWFFACAVDELLVANRAIDFLYLADAGFLGVVAVLLIVTIRRVVRDAHRLDALGRELSDQVEHRTRERDLARDALTHAERLAAIGQLAAGVGHEINNPLTVVRANLDLVREDPRRADRGLLLDEAADGAARIARVVADLRTYALPGTGVELVDVTAALGAARKLAAHRLRHVARVVEDFGALAPVRGDPVRLSQVFVNLLVNAGQALEDAARPTPEVTLRARMADGRVVIEIVDNGVGIRPDALARLSEPYFSTRVDRGGTGLGLFVARGILTSLDGTLTFASEVGVGTTARVTLPAAGPVGAPPLAAPVDHLRAGDPVPAAVQAVALPAAGPAAVEAPAAAPPPAAPPPAAPPPAAPPPAAPPPAAPPPAAPPPAAPPPVAPPPVADAPSRRRVVVIDDEPIVARSVARMLADAEVTTFTDPVAALDHLLTAPAPDAVVCDLMMPGITGIELHATLSAKAPALVPHVVFVTGGAVTAAAQAFLARPDVTSVDKPFDRATLRRAIDDAAARA